MLCKSKILTLVTMVYSWYVYEYCFMDPCGRFTHVMTYDVDWDRLGTMVELPVQGRLCPIFVSRDSGRVIRHLRVFRGLAGSQRTPGDRGVTAWYQSIGIRKARA